MKPAWSSFVNHLGVAVEFLHRDEFKEKYPREDAEFPSASVDRGGELELLLSTEEMNSAKSLDEPIGIVKKKLREEGLGKPTLETAKATLALLSPRPSPSRRSR